ncbi:MAG: malate synthase A [Arthrobacter sp.]|nr:malate synthase A [Arthrobacter sp.]
MTTTFELTAQPIRRQGEILIPEALEFIERLHRALGERRTELLDARHGRRARIAGGEDPQFPHGTEHIREDRSWRVAPPAPGLNERRVELAGPTDRRTTISALNSGASVWVADFEDSLTPSWRNIISGQLNLMDALERRIDFTAPDGTELRLTEGTLPTIVMRPRGLHLPEKHLLSGGQPVSGSIVDFGLYFFHNARRLLAQGRGPYFYLPKVETHQEARWWNDLFILAQDLLGLPQGTIRATVLIETISAAFEMEEILYELRDHASGLAAGHWDYIFSLIKTFRTRGPRFVLPDRSQITMEQPFIRAYSEQLVHICHKRGAMAIGGMSAEVPSRRDAAQNARATAAVRADTTRFAVDGFDGTWVAHPDLVSSAREVFDAALGQRPHQMDRQRLDVVPDARALIDLSQTTGTITEAGIRSNVEIGIRYIESWLRGNGAVTIRRNMEDASTAEISRSQLWQWIHNQAITDQGEVITREWVTEIFEEVYSGLERFEGDRFRDARELFEEVALASFFPTFLTIPAYARFLSTSAEDARERRLVAA